MAQQQPLHRNGCPQILRDVESELVDPDKQFADTFEIGRTFQIDCLGWCLDYLVTVRNYHRMEGRFNRVHFTEQDPSCMTDVSCFLRGPYAPNGMHRQIATHEDINLGNRQNGAIVRGGRIYWFYGPTGGMSALALLLMLEWKALQLMTHRRVYRTGRDLHELRRYSST